MKCISCEIEIDPKWTHAIDINVCPFCGKPIMDEALKNLFAFLRITMNDLKDYTDQLDDWMLSNHNYIRTNSPKIGEYMPKSMLDEIKKAAAEKEFQEKKYNQTHTIKVKTDSGEEDVEVNKIQSDESTNAFFKRSEATKINGEFKNIADKTQHLKNLAQQIKKAGAPLVNESGGIDFVSPQMIEQADPEAVAELQSFMSDGNVIASSLSNGDDDDIPAAVLAMAKNSGNKGGSSKAADLLKLQEMQNRVQRSKDNFESGENRGGKGGGFSRSG
jgi:hypothetical protein